MVTALLPLEPAVTVQPLPASEIVPPVTLNDALITAGLSASATVTPVMASAMSSGVARGVAAPLSVIDGAVVSVPSKPVSAKVAASMPPLAVSSTQLPPRRAAPVGSVEAAISAPVAAASASTNA